MLAPFEAPKLKIERARHHLQELEQGVSDFLGRDPFALIVEHSTLIPESGMHAWAVRIREPIPAHFSAIIGDVIHNLRTALDLTACDLVRRADDGDVKNVYFPFCEDQADLSKMIKRRQMHRAGPEVVKIIMSLEPYIGGNRALRAVHELDVQDKHQALIPVMSVAASPSANINFFGNQKATPIPTIHTRISKDGQAVWIMPPVHNLPLGTKLSANFWLMLGANAAGFDGHEVIKTLHEFAQLVDGIVNLFAGKFGPRKDGPTAT